ncbi:MAG: hypothetical protein J2P16_13265 [Mycobacterium sp.]|nr:hypothetical protein [Mycobacterium sp.]
MTIPQKSVSRRAALLAGGGVVGGIGLGLEGANAALAAGGSNSGIVTVDSFPGPTDDAKFQSAVSFAASQTYPPAIQFLNRSYVLSTPVNCFAGFRMIGPFGEGISNAELGSTKSKMCAVNLSTNGVFLNVTGGDAWDNYIGGLCFLGSSRTTFMSSTDGSSCWHCSKMHDVSFHGFRTVLGSQTQKLLILASQIDGWFEIGGTYNGGMHIGGSDSRLFMDGALIDSSTAYLSAGGATGQYHLWCEGMDNSTVGPMYITAEAGWGGLRVTGMAYNSDASGNLAMLTFSPGLVVEGRSANAPCDGSVIRVDGGNVHITHAYIARAMYSPATMGHSPADAGAVMVTGGTLTLRDCIYDRYSGQPETDYFVYTSSSGPVQVTGTTVATKGGTWTGLPQVHNAGAGQLLTDSLVTEV